MPFWQLCCSILSLFSILLCFILLLIYTTGESLSKPTVACSYCSAYVHVYTVQYVSKMFPKFICSVLFCKHLVWSLDAILAIVLLNFKPVFHGKVTPERLKYIDQLSASANACVKCVGHGRPSAVIDCYLQGISTASLYMAKLERNEVLKRRLLIIVHTFFNLFLCFFSETQQKSHVER